MKSILTFALTLAAPLLASAANSPRITQNFDAGWEFRKSDTLQSTTPWRHVRLPHDWAIEDLPPLVVTNQLPIVSGEWRFSFGDDAAWKEPGFDDSTWARVPLPAYWSQHPGKAPTDSFGWYRRRIEIPPALRGHDVWLALGQIDDVDETFVNGVRVGGMGCFPPTYSTEWTAQRRYRVPAHLLKGDGTDLVAVRVYNGEGDGGMYSAPGPMRRSGPFDFTGPTGTAQGYTLQGIGWYRKSFALPEAWRGRHINLRFDGVYMDASVWLNGVLLGIHPYGYTSFYFDLTPHLKFGGAKNELLVKVDASGRTSRWYSGAGIYRHVWLTATDPVHIVTWGVYVTTPEVSATEATVRVRTTVANGNDAAVQVRLLDPEGKFAGSAEGTDASVVVERPRLWSCDTPSLYRAVTTMTVGDRTVDEVTTTFGIRSESLDATHGFLLNGKPLKLRGGCVHHANGCLGSCTFDRAEERRVELLKAAGFNAIRTSHNPPSPAFLDACDRLGMIVMDEAFDCWAHGKNPQDYGRFFHDWWKKDLDSMVLRDRNHPSVMFWSIGNEIPEQRNGAEAGPRAKMLANEVRRLDPTRPVAQATNPQGEKLEPVCEQLDLVGYNYSSYRFASDHAKHPERVFAGTEEFPVACYQSWMTVVKHPYVIGNFVWTALDYLGEAGLGKAVFASSNDHRPWTVSNCGDLDLCGWRRPQNYYRNAVWGLNEPVSAFVETPGSDGKPARVEGWGWRDEQPSWTWPGQEGQSLTVRVYSRCPRVQLLLNGKDLGVKDAAEDMAKYEVPYEPGELVAVGLTEQGDVAGRWTLRTAGPPARIRLMPDRTTLQSDGEDLSFVKVELLDAHGVLCPNSHALVHFSLDGPATLAGVGNGDPRSDESFQQPRRHAYHGRCLIVLRAGTQPGATQLTASVDGLPRARVEIAERP